MKEYSVKQVSEMLQTNPETVRRWIRSGKLYAVQSSKKGGNVISEESLRRFLKDTPKYSSVFTASVIAASVAASAAGMALPVIAGGILAPFLLKKDTSTSPTNVQDELRNIDKRIKELERSTKKKRDTIEQLERDINEETKMTESLKDLRDMLMHCISEEEGVDEQLR